MTDDYDDNAVYGDEIGYVPCFQAASAVPTLTADDNAVYGEESGYVPLDTGAAADPASEQDELAVYGDNVGFVAKPCEECIDFDFSAAVPGLQQNIGNAALVGFIYRDVGDTFIVGPAGDSVFTSTTGVGSHVESYAQGDPPILIAKRSERRYHVYVSHDAPFPDNTHARLRLRILPSTGQTLSALPVGVDWVMYQGTWGAATPGFDDVGSIIASGTVAQNPPGGPFSNHVDVDVYVPVVGGRVQFIFGMGAQNFGNALNGYTDGVVFLGEPATFVAPKWPDTFAAAQNWQWTDGYTSERPSPDPDAPTSYVPSDYSLQWYTVPPCP
jgi:hypothetical protein